MRGREPAAKPQIFRAPKIGTAGVGLAVLGFAVGAILSGILVVVVAGLTHDHLVKGAPAVQTSPVTTANLVGLWLGLVGAAVLASRLLGSRHPASDLGLRLRLWPDLPLGAVVGLGFQFVVLPLLYLPLEASNPHLTKKLSNEGITLTSHVGTTGLVVVAVLVVVGAPIVEEIFFRGLLMPSLEAAFGVLGRRLAIVVAIVVMGVAFGFAHSEGWLVAYGLAVFGMALGVLAKCFKRLGPGIVAHGAFNLFSVLLLAYPHLYSSIALVP